MIRILFSNLNYLELNWLFEYHRTINKLNCVYYEIYIYLVYINWWKYLFNSFYDTYINCANFYCFAWYNMFLDPIGSHNFTQLDILNSTRIGKLSRKLQKHIHISKAFIARIAPQHLHASVIPGRYFFFHLSVFPYIFNEPLNTNFEEKMNFWWP